MAAESKAGPDKAKKTPPKKSNKTVKSTGVKLTAKAIKPAAKRTKKATPKKPVITDDDFEKWFLRQNSQRFKYYTKQWNEAKLKIRIPPSLEGYDEWFNYFAGLPPTVIKQLAISGLDFLPTDGYSALARWHDIISHPSRIDKIHQSGLTRKPNHKDDKSISQLAHDNDRLGVLKATRDRIAEKLEKGAGARDTAALAREMTEIMTQISDYEKRQGPKKTTKLGQLLGDIDLRKRPGTNGGGSRHTSFKSRVTIKDLEG